MVIWTIAFASVVVALAAGAFFILYRPWQLSWGATSDELVRSMPGDEIVHRPVFNATRAVTIHAAPEDIWPWLVQIGFGRAGWYTYDYLDNLGRHSADRILPELQHIEPGDLVPVGPGKDAGMRVKAFERNQWVLWWNKRNERTTWVWGLYPTPGGATRLVTRVRAPYSWRQPLSFVWMPLLEFADLPLMRKCLRGIKRRAEALAADNRQAHVHLVSEGNL